MGEGSAAVPHCLVQTDESEVMLLPLDSSETVRGIGESMKGKRIL